MCTAILKFLSIITHLLAVDLILLGSSIQVLPLNKLLEESWAAFPEARQRLLQLIASAEVQVVLLSGDVHMAEVSRATCSVDTIRLNTNIKPKLTNCE